MRIERRDLAPGQLDHERLWTVVGLAAAGLAVVAVRLDVVPTLPCTFHALTGLPCPTCGATRAFQALLAGRCVEALRLNPLATLAAVAFAAYVAYALPVSLARRPRLRLVLDEVERRRVRAAAWSLLAAAWAFLVLDGR